MIKDSLLLRHGRCLTVCQRQGHSKQQPWGRRQRDSLGDNSAPGNRTRSVRSPSPWGGSLGLRSPGQLSVESEKKQEEQERNELKIELSQENRILPCRCAENQQTPPNRRRSFPTDHKSRLSVLQKPHEDIFAFLLSLIIALFSG